MLERLRAELFAVARARQTLTYAELAAKLVIQPPLKIHRTTQLLEELIREQAHDGEPQLAAVVVSRGARRLPARGFFMLLNELGLHSGEDEGEAAARRHAVELTRVFDWVQRIDSRLPK